MAKDKEGPAQANAPQQELPPQELSREEEQEEVAVCTNKLAGWDNVLKTLDLPFFKLLAAFCLFQIIFWIFLLAFAFFGVHDWCSPNRFCEPYVTIYMTGVHALNVSVDILLAMCLPWRILNFRHAHLEKCDWHGRPSNFFWFHIPSRRRVWICVILIWNAIFHYINQCIQIYYYNYYTRQGLLNVFYVNVFVGLSLSCIIIATSWIFVELLLLRRAGHQFPYRQFFVRLGNHYNLDDADDKENDQLTKEMADQISSDDDDEVGAIDVEAGSADSAFAQS